MNNEIALRYVIFTVIKRSFAATSFCHGEDVSDVAISFIFYAIALVSRLEDGL